MSDPKRILIVDDEPNVRLVFRTALESPDAQLATAEDGEVALRWLKDFPADLVLLDLHMPLLDGMETLRRLRETGNDVPVVIITAHGSVPDAVQAMKYGAIDFLSKPLSPDALRKVVAEVLARHAAPSPEPVRKADAPKADEQFALNLSHAKRALNRRAFDEAETSLRLSIAVDPRSAEAHNLMGVLHELRNEHDASYRSYKAALKADRRYEPAKHNMQRYYERFTFGSSTLPVDLGDD